MINEKQEASEGSLEGANQDSIKMSMFEKKPKENAIMKYSRRFLKNQPQTSKNSKSKIF